MVTLRGGGMHHLHFGGRYKSQPQKRGYTEQERLVMSSGAGFASSGSISALSPALAVVAPTFVMTGAIQFSEAANGFGPRNNRSSRLPEEPKPELPEDRIKQAMEQLEEDRRRQQAMKIEICNTYEAEAKRLMALKTQVTELEKQVVAPDAALNWQEINLREKKQEIITLEKTVAQMKINADAAIALDSQFSARMETLKKQYLAMKDQLLQIEQNKRLLEMQKSLEKMKGSGFQSPDLNDLQEQIDQNLDKTTPLVEQFLKEAEALGQTQVINQAEAIERLKKQSVNSVS